MKTKQMMLLERYVVYHTPEFACCTTEAPESVCFGRPQHSVVDVLLAYSNGAILGRAEISELGMM